LLPTVLPELGLAEKPIVDGNTQLKCHTDQLDLVKQVEREVGIKVFFVDSISAGGWCYQQ
jgi:hypothetical protein